MDDLRQKSADFFLEIWNKQAFDQLGDYVSDHCIVEKFGAEAADVEGIDEVKAVMDRTIELMPDLHFIVEQCLVDDNMTAVHWHGKGTVNGKPLAMDGMTIAKWENGKMVQGWNAFEAAIIKQTAMAS